MAISSAIAKALIDSSARYSLSGKVLTLGVQTLKFSKDDLLKDHGIVFPFSKLDFKSFFRFIGFDEVFSLDASEYEGADIIADLNKCFLEYEGVFDFIFDGGTLEHVFNIPVALENLTNMLKVTGKIIHFLPTNNAVDHGFYQFSPIFFVDYYRVNEFTIYDVFIARRLISGEKESWDFITYCPSMNIKLGNLDDSLYGTFFCAEKTNDSHSGKIPQQSIYDSDKWKKNFGKEINDSLWSDALIKENVFIYGYSSLAEELSTLLEKNGFLVLGFFDTYKFGYKSSKGVIKAPKDMFEISDCSVIFACKNLKGQCRNDIAIRSLCSQVGAEFDNSVFIHKDSALSYLSGVFDEYQMLIDRFVKSAKKVNLDEMFMRPNYKKYIGSI